MTFWPAERVREPAIPMNPLVDPAGWRAEDLAGNEDWIYELSAEEKDDIRKAVATVQRRGLDILQVTKENFPLPVLDAGLRQMYDELLEGRGFVLIRGMPIAEFDKIQAGIAFWVSGCASAARCRRTPRAIFSAT